MRDAYMHVNHPDDQPPGQLQSSNENRATSVEEKRENI